MARKGLTKFIIARWGLAQEISFLLACCFMRPSGGGVRSIKKGGLIWVETHFKEGDINEELIDKMVQLLGKYYC